jgi:2'-5' RNA ligase
VDDFFAGIERQWPVGREDIHCLVIPDTGRARKQLTEPYRDLTARSGLAPVEPERCHITVHHGPRLSDTTEDAMQQVTGIIREGCRSLSPFTARIRRPSVRRSGVVCPVYPGLPFGELHALVTSAFGCTDGEQPATYDPHLALAYATASHKDGGLRSWLCDHDLPELEIQVSELTLVKQRHNRCEITWDVLSVIPLGTGEDR